MIYTDWDAITKRYQHDHAISGITIKDWCKQNGVNYASARRYLKSDSQLPTQSQTFYVATPNEEKQASNEPGNWAKTGKPRNAAESVRSAQSAQSDSAQCATSAQIDSHGRFVKGNTMSVGNPGNPNPHNQMKPGNQAAKKHAGYSKFFPAGKFDDAREMRLRDELVLARTQLISVAENLQQIDVDLKSTTDPEIKASLYKSMIHLQTLLDERIARIESLTRTLSNVKLTEATVPYRVAETERSKVVARKGAVETRMLEREEGGDTTPIGDIISEIQTMGSGGLMSGPTGNETGNHG